MKLSALLTSNNPQTGILQETSPDLYTLASSDRCRTLIIVSMRIRSALAPGAISLGKRIADISHDANKRLKWFDYYESHGKNARETCRHFGISPDTFYRWRKHYCPGDLRSLEERSRRPKHVRRPTWRSETVKAVQELREHYPRWGKAKLVRVAESDAGPVRRTNARPDVRAAGRAG